MALLREPLEAVREPGGPHPGEVLADDKLWARRAVRVNRDLCGRPVDDVWSGASLNPAEGKVRLEIDAPHLVGDQCAVDVVVERSVGVDMHHGREVPGTGRERSGIYLKRSLLQRPVSPHRPAGVDGPRGVGDVDTIRQVEHRPEVADPRPGRDDHLVAGYSPVACFNGRDPQAGDLRAWHDPHAGGQGLAFKAAQRELVVGVAALLLVQHRGRARRLPVWEHLEHVGAAVIFPFDEHRVVSDGLLLLVDLHHVGVHGFRCGLEEAD